MINPSSIHSIIFDLGGVLLDIKPEITIMALSEIAGIEPQRLGEMFVASNIVPRYETGHLDDSQFRDAIRGLIHSPMSDQQIDDVWNSLLLDFPKRRVEMLKKLKEHFHILLLSNTNPIHYRHYTTRFLQDYGFGFDFLFDKQFLSQQMGMRKPDVEVFRYVVSQAQISASGSLFIDDTLANVQAAGQCGLQALHLAPGMEIADWMDDFLERAI